MGTRGRRDSGKESLTIHQLDHLCQGAICTSSELSIEGGDCRIGYRGGLRLLPVSLFTWVWSTYNVDDPLHQLNNLVLSSAISLRNAYLCMMDWLSAEFIP